MEIFVTGGGGLLGHHAIQELLDRGDRVRVLALPGEDVSWLEDRGVVVHRGDIRDPESLKTPMQGVDGVLHLAGMMGMWRPLEDYRAVNVTGTENVCRAALAQSVHRLVHISSWTVYGMSQPTPCGEDRPLAPFAEPYALSKAEGDRLVQRMIADSSTRNLLRSRRSPALRPDRRSAPRPQVDSRRSRRQRAAVRLRVRRRTRPAPGPGSRACGR